VFKFQDLNVEPGTRAFTRLPVANLLAGSALTLPVHIIHGTEPGPVLGITSAVHGAEFVPIRIVRQALIDLDPKQLKGTVIAIPVCNPLSFAKGTRITPDEDDVDFSNLNRVFPGRREKALFGAGSAHETDRTLTEAIAAVLTEKFLPHINHILDFHAHFRGNGLIKTIQQTGQTGQQAKDTEAICRAYGLGLIHEHAATGKSLTATAAQMGISTCVPEIGGGGLSLQAEDRCVELGVRGIYNVMKYLKMMPGEMELPKRQLVFEIAPHVRPTTAGYLVSCYDPDDLFTGEEAGVPVKAGQELGWLFDPYTFEKLETLRSPVDGILYISRRSGPLEAGAHAFAVADYNKSHWIN
jgi:predicted deacylase